MTSLKEKLDALNTEAEGIENDIKNVNGSHTEMMSQLDKIETFIGDNKEAIENEIKEGKEVEESYEKLLQTVNRIKNEVNTLKTQNQALKDKIGKVAGLCVFGGVATGASLTLLFQFLRNLINKHKKTEA